jgi:hypothetical protein
VPGSSWVPIQEQGTIKADAYPNPVKDELIISLSNEGGEGSLQIYNLMGQLVKRQEIALNGGNKPIVARIKDLPAGLYMARITVNQEVYVIKFIKEE